MLTRLPDRLQIGKQEQEQLQAGVKEHGFLVDADLDRRGKEGRVVRLQMLPQLLLVVDAHQNARVRDCNAFFFTVRFPDRAAQAIRAVIDKDLRNDCALQDDWVPAAPVVGRRCDIGCAGKQRVERLRGEHRGVDRRKDHAVTFALQIRKSQLDGGKQLRPFAFPVFDEHNAQRRDLPRDLQLLCPRHDHDGKHARLLQGQDNTPDDWNTADLQKRHRVLLACRRDHRAHRTEFHAASLPSLFLISYHGGIKTGKPFLDAYPTSCSSPCDHLPKSPEEVSIDHFQHTGQYAALHTAGDHHAAQG